MGIALAELADAHDIHALQRLAYGSEAALYPDVALPPLTQTLEGTQADLARHLVLKLCRDGRIVGSVRGVMSDDTCRIGRLIVHPDYQNRGLGRALMAEIERRFAHAARFELFTGQRSARALHLYDRLGYRPFRTERVSESLTLVYLEKLAAGPECTAQPTPAVAVSPSK